jgi:hypothetical protein
MDASLTSLGVMSFDCSGASVALSMESMTILIKQDD